MSGPPTRAEAQALGDPTRHRIFEHVARQDAPASVAELAAVSELNHTTVRQHLAQLVAAGLLEVSTAPPAGGGRGRPRLMYQVTAAARERWLGPSAYERLAGLLAEVVRTGDSPEDVGRRSVSRRQVRGRSGVGVAGLVKELERDGFRPEARPVGDADATIELHSCPFASAVDVAADTVCGLHLGLSRGLADAVGDVEVTELVATDPRRGSCFLRVRR